MQTASPEMARYLEHGFDCWNRRAIAEMMDMYTDDAVVDLTGFLPDEDILVGRDEIFAYYERMWDTWSDFSWKPQEALDLGDDRYAMVVSVEAEGRGSGAPAMTQMTIFYKLAGGRIARAAFEAGRSPQLKP